MFDRYYLDNNLFGESNFIKYEMIDSKFEMKI